MEFGDGKLMEEPWWDYFFVGNIGRKMMRGLRTMLGKKSREPCLENDERLEDHSWKKSREHWQENDERLEDHSWNKIKGTLPGK